MCRLMGNVVMLERTPILIILILIFIVVLEKCAGSCSIHNIYIIIQLKCLDSIPENGFIKILYTVVIKIV